VADLPRPRPEDVAALGDAVNEVYRGMAISPDAIFPAPGRGKSAWDAHADHLHVHSAREPEGDDLTVTGASPQAERALQALWAHATGEGPHLSAVNVWVTASQASEVLTLAVSLAYGHQHDHHPDKPWMTCEPYTQVVQMACGLFTTVCRGEGL
jgi:hypothetical protein